MAFRNAAVKQKIVYLQVEMEETKKANRLPKARMTYEQAFNINGNMPPQATDIEESVLGALLLDQDALSNSIDIIKPEYFYLNEHAEIFRAISSLFAEGSPVDIMTESERLKKNGTFETVGGYSKLTSLTTRITSAAHIEYHVRLLSEKFIQRELIRVSTETLRDSYDETNDVLDLLDKTETKFLEINDSNFNSDILGMDVLLRQTINEIEKAQSSADDASGLPSGFRELDNKIGGFQKGTLIILAARPAMGKTALAITMARNMAVDFHKPVAIFSLEMTASELTSRLISAEASIEGRRFKSQGKLEEWEKTMIREKTQSLANAPIYIDDNPGLSIFELRAKCRRLKQKYDIQMIFIDYLQLMQGGDAAKGGNREQEISYISRQLKALSKELGIPVLALSQLSRAVETRGGSKKPVLSDLRESGAIEQDADIVMFIYRPAYYGMLDEGDDKAADVIIAKHRAGEVGEVRLNFIPQFVRFENRMADGGSFPMGETLIGSSMNDSVSDDSLSKFTYDEGESSF